MAYQTEAFAYRVGDEVVVRLDDVAAFDLTAGVAVTSALPAWTIGDLTARLEQRGVRLYAARFRFGEATCIALVDERAIEGIA